MDEARNISDDLVQAIKKLQNQTQTYPGWHATALDALSNIFKYETDLLPSESPLPAQPMSTNPTQPRDIRATPHVTPEVPETTFPELSPIQHTLHYPLLRVKE